MSEGTPKRSEAQGEARAWGDNPWAAFAIRATVFLVPVALSFLVTWFIARSWTAPAAVPSALLRLVVLGVVAVGVAMLADNGAKRFLPLATLFRLSLVFPDQAPSRFAVALRSGNTKRIEQRLSQVEAGSFTGSQADAALLVVELAAALSDHDRLTRGHSERVRAYTELIAEEMGLSPEDSNKLQWAGLIHDVGKLRIPQEILTKPGKLTKKEFDIIRTHPEEGMKLAEPLREYLAEWIGAVGEHHERFDGKGYPNGLSGVQISLAGRIVAVADAYDVITAARSYKKPLAPAFARQELADNAGTQFDPVVVRAFLSVSLGRLRRAMWPLSWAAQVPFLGPAITAPVTQTLVTAAAMLTAVTGAAAVTGPLVVPESIAFAAEDSPATTVALDEPAQASSDDPQAAGVEPTTSASSGPAVTEPHDSSTTAAPFTSTTTEAVRTSEPEELEPTSSTVAFARPETTTTSTAPDVLAPVTTAATRSAFPTTTTVKPQVFVTTTTTTGTTPTKATTTTTTASTSTTTTTTTTTVVSADCSRAMSGERELQDANLRGCELGAVTISGADFTGADFTGARFDGTVISGGLFKDAVFDGATFTGANIWAADFRDTSFVGVQIRETGFHDVNLAGADFDGATLVDAGMNATLTNASFVRAEITRVGLGGAVLEGADLSHATVEGSNFSFAWLLAADFDNATFVDSNFYDAKDAPVGHANASYSGVKCVDGIVYDRGCW